ncbi:hypothetical protein [Streptomyces sp. or20]|uniref:hypothetical protein n=1 Tax=Streptomyces sp. or20 TaxID=1828016 RepID=UPI00211D3A01|nr:hypothetical protein [Streptomyces sp. or20]
MNRQMITTAPLAAVLVPVAAAPAAPAAPTAVRTPYVDKRVNACAGPHPGCRPGAVAHYW